MGSLKQATSIRNSTSTTERQLRIPNEVKWMKMILSFQMKHNITSINSNFSSLSLNKEHKMPCQTLYNISTKSLLQLPQFQIRSDLMKGQVQTTIIIITIIIWTELTKTLQGLFNDFFPWRITLLFDVNSMMDFIQYGHIFTLFYVKIILGWGIRWPNWSPNPCSSLTLHRCLLWLLSSSRLCSTQITLFATKNQWFSVIKGPEACPIYMTILL